MSLIFDYKQKLADLRVEEAAFKRDLHRRQQELEKEVTALQETRTVYRCKYTPSDGRHCSYKLGLYTTSEMAERCCRKSGWSDGVDWNGTVVMETRVLTLHDIEILDTPTWP